MMKLHEPDALALLQELGTAFTFHVRPVPIPGDTRPEWRMAVVVLMLSVCGRSGRSSVNKLHVLNWSMRTSKSRAAFLAKLRGELAPIDITVQFDPALNRAIDLARGEKLVERDGKNSLQLLQKGEQWAKEIFADPMCLVQEKHFLGEIGKTLTEKEVTTLLHPSSIW